jgi:4-alpha-glucanotransferase
LLVDTIRLDHFRGLEAYYTIPATAPTAETGHWEKGPGAALLTALQHEFNPLPLLAEDLGYITPEVTALKRQFHLPGMQVLHFAFYDTPAGCARISTPAATFVYTGTHDNNTTLGWYRQTIRGQSGEACLTSYLGRVSEVDIAAKLVEFAYASNGSTVIIPVQDLLGLDESHRMNTPGTVGGNWQFRLKRNQLTLTIASKLAALTAKYQRKISFIQQVD